MAAVEHGGTDSILIAVFCRSISGGAADRPYERLQYLVADAAHRHNIHLAESFYVAVNGWGSFCCDDPRCEYAGPRPIAELEDWAAFRGMTF